MGSEMLLYGYGIICLSMIVFNTIYSLTLKGRDARLEKRIGQFENKVEAQIARIRDNKPVKRNHFAYLRRKLSRVYNLVAFDRVLKKQFAEKESPALTAYMQRLQPVLLHLALAYKKRDSLEAAYFMYFIGHHQLQRRMPMDTLQTIIVEYMSKDNLYCRINALQALYSFGSVENIVEAITVQDRSGLFLHEKILQEGLLSFTGDHEQLIRLLWARIGEFSEKTQLSVLNYIRYKSGNYCKEMLNIMLDPTKNKELRLSAIRYFGRYAYEPAREPLLAFAANLDQNRWEYAAVSASSLAVYQGEDVEDILIEAMHSANWYVRYNAAISLEAHDLNYEDLIEVVGGKDRYAREMLMYRLDSRRLERQKKAVQA